MPNQDLPSKSLLTNLSVKDIETLTQVLTIHAGAALDGHWLATQAQQIESLPKCLLAPKSGLGSIFRTNSSFHGRTQKATLCNAHRGLHPQLIHRIFIQLVQECTVRNARLVSSTNLPLEVEEWRKRIQMINSLWMSPELYRVAFNVMPEDERLEQVDSGCEACILSVVGSHQLMLLDLRNSAESRKKKSPTKPPTILRFLDAWLAGTGLQETPKKAHEIMKYIRQIRRELLVERRKLRDERTNGKKSAGIIDQGSELGRFEFDFSNGEGKEEEDYGNGDDREDAESIVVFYLDKFTDTRGGPKSTQPAEGMHPAFRQSVNFSGAYRAAASHASDTVKPSSSYSEHGCEYGSHSSSNRPGGNGAYGEGIYAPPGRQEPPSKHGILEPKYHWYDESVYAPSEHPPTGTDRLSSASPADEYQIYRIKQPEPVLRSLRGNTSSPESSSRRQASVDRMSTLSAETRWSDFGRFGEK